MSRMTRLDLIEEFKKAEKSSCKRLHQIRDLMDRSKVSLNRHSTLSPTAIFCVLHCLQPLECLPESYGGVARTIAYSLALGVDIDTIACMAGAIAGAHYGIETIPGSRIRCCEGAEEAEQNVGVLHAVPPIATRGHK